MKRRGSRGARGFLGWVAVVLAVVLVVGPALRPPMQYAMAQTKPVPAAKPVLDISGIQEIQSIPVGESRLYYPKEVVDDVIEEFGEEAKDFFNLTPLELPLNSIANLAILQMSLTEYTKIDPETGAVILEGDFGRVLQEILGIDPERDLNMSVEHTDFIQTPGLTPEFDRDYYTLTINCRQIELTLTRYFGDPAQGYNWGVVRLLLRQDSEREFAANGLPLVEEKVLFCDIDKNTGKFYSVYTFRIVGTDGVRVLKYEQMRFEQGNPEPLFHRPMGPP